MPRRPLAELIDSGWVQALDPVSGQITEMGDFLRAEVASGRQYLPAGDVVLRAFTQPLSQVRVLIVGQDPYPTPGNPVGLSFSVRPASVRCLAACRTSSPWSLTSACGRRATAISPWAAAAC